MKKPDIVDRICDLLSYRFDQYVDRWQVIVALVVAGIILVLSFGLFIRDRIISTPKVIQTVSLSAGASEADPDKPGFLFVYICGAVNKPGVFRVGNGTRLNALVALAGGLAADADAAPVNLAKKLTDGERIYIPKIGERLNTSNPTTNASGPAGADGGNASGPTRGSGLGSASNGGQTTSAWNADGKLNLNTASSDDLDKLPGIGPAFITRILDYRQKHNGFTDIAQLRNIEGVGPKTFAKLKDLVYVE